MLSYTPTPIQEINDVLFDKAGVRVWVKREDLNHSFISGNKWWKLKYNLQEAIDQGKKTLLTFGGAYSNHIYATAAAAQECNLKSIGIIRGEETLPLNPTLSFAQAQGMLIHYVTREIYRKKSEPEFLQQLHDRFGDFYMIPEGGTNDLALKGVEEFAKTLGSEVDHICCACGTGGTLAGLIRGLSSSINILGVSVLKGDFLSGEVRGLFGKQSKSENWRIETDYHFGGYAKQSRELVQFIQAFETKFQIPLEQVYTGKAMYALFDLIKNNHFKKGSQFLLIHTGGMQGGPPSISSRTF